MPKQVDHAARRQELAEALWRVVGRDGFEGVSLRQVAAEAGVSMGLVQHDFRTKDDMLVFSLDVMDQRTGDRFMAALAELPDPPPPRAAVRAFLTQMLPLDPERHAENRSLYAMMGGIARNDRIGEPAARLAWSSCRTTSPSRSRMPAGRRTRTARPPC